jgi:phage shock protein A
MGIFSRISDIVNSNINAMLDKAEDPEKMVKLMINEMEDTLIEVKSAAAEVVADRIRLNRVMKLETERRQDWEGKAALAIEKGREDLAREALERKIACEKQIATYENRLAEVEGLVKQYQEDIARLEEKLDSARSRQRTLIANHKSAVNRRAVEDKIYRLETSGAFARFEHYEKRIDRFQAEAEVMHQSNVTLEKKFQDLTHDQSVEDELAKLKAKVGSKGKAGKVKAEAV